MPAIKKILVLSLALIMSLTLIGCAGGGLSHEEINQIVANAATNAAGIDTSKFDLFMTMTIEVVGGSQAGEMSAVVDTSGAIDNVDKELLMTMNMTMGVPDQEEQKWAIEAYGTGGWLYVGVAVPGQEVQWQKTALTEELWQQQSQLEQQIEFLSAATKIKYLGSEAVNGTDCYMVEITPSMEALGNLMTQQLGTLGINAEQLNVADQLKKISVKEWIAKDSYLPMKSEVVMRMEIRPEDVGATKDDFDKMTMDIDIGTTFYDYNQEVSVTLPPEALNAPETE